MELSSKIELTIIYRFRSQAQMYHWRLAQTRLPVGNSGEPSPKVPSTRSIAPGYSRRSRQPVPGKITVDW